jgi:hypothetical protein
MDTNAYLKSLKCCLTKSPNPSSTVHFETHVWTFNTNLFHNTFICYLINFETFIVVSWWNNSKYFLQNEGTLSFQINHQSDATNFQPTILTSIYSSTCFGRFPAHYQEFNDYSSSLWIYLRIVVIAVLCSWSGRLYNRLDHEHNTVITTIRR